MAREFIFPIGTNFSELTEDLDRFISSLVRFFPNRFWFLSSGDWSNIEAGKGSLQVFHSHLYFPRIPESGLPDQGENRLPSPSRRGRGKGLDMERTHKKWGNSSIA